MNPNAQRAADYATGLLNLKLSMDLLVDAHVDLSLQIERDDHMLQDFVEIIKRLEKHAESVGRMIENLN